MQEEERKYQETLAWLETEPLMKNLRGDAMEPLVWYRKKLDGYVNAGGSDDWMYLKKGTTENLAIFFIGGGFAFNAEMAFGGGGIRDFFCPPEKPHFFTDEAHPNNEYYFLHVLGNHGLFSLDPENRFADWNIAMINYGTGDIHIGNADHTYTDEEGNTITLHHHGYRNFLAAMDVIHRLFGSPESLVICGASAGGFGVSALAGDIVEGYPECKNITICIDSACLRHPEWPQIVKELWKAPDHIAEAAVSDNVVLDMVRMNQKRIGDRAKYLFMIGYPDGVLSIFQNYVDHGQMLPSEEATREFAAILKEQLIALKQLEIPFHIYLHDFVQNDMIQHVTLDAPTFWQGVISPMEWLWNAVNGKCEDRGMQLLQ